tara:strand:+ start:1786 stop:2019 length:234 start_codon:yes stop_codon:yes gene_type:complete
MQPLDYVTTPELIKELQRRYDDLVLIAASQRTPRDEDLIVSISGSYHGILGLTEIARMAARAGDGSYGDEDKDNASD